VEGLKISKKVGLRDTVKPTVGWVRQKLRPMMPRLLSVDTEGTAAEEMKLRNGAVDV